MGMDLRGALVKAGLATQEQAKEIEKKAEAAKKASEKKVEHIERRRERYQTNRFAKPYAYIDWFKKKLLPKDAQQRCFHCGEVGHDPITAFDAIWKEHEKEVAQIREKGDQFTLVKWMNAGMDKAREIGKEGKMLQSIALLMAMEDHFALQFFEAKGVHPVSCRACTKFYIANEMGAEMAEQRIPGIPKEVYDPNNLLK